MAGGALACLEKETNKIFLLWVNLDLMILKIVNNRGEIRFLPINMKLIRLERKDLDY